MPRIHPTLLVRMTIDERCYDSELPLEIKRNYNHVAPTTIESCHVDTREIINTIRYDVVLHRAYWNSADEGADDLWATDLPEWLHNAIYKVSNNVAAQNATHREHNEDELEFTWAELRFGENALFAFKTQADSTLSMDAIGAVVSGREHMNAGDWGSNVACVRIPSKQQYDEQVQQAREQLSEEAADAKTISFDPETTIWGIEYADGSARQFDTQSNAFID